MIEPIKILNFNSDGIENKIGEIETLIALIQPALAVITDTRLKQNLVLTGYSLVQQNSDDSFGGVLVAIHHGIANGRGWPFQLV